MNRILMVVIIILVVNSIQAIDHEVWFKAGLNHIKVEGDFYRLNSDNNPVKCRNINDNEMNLSVQLRMYLHKKAFVSIGNRLNTKSAKFQPKDGVLYNRSSDALTTFDIPLELSYYLLPKFFISGGASISIPIYYDRLNAMHDYSDLETVRTTYNLETAITFQHKWFLTEFRYIHELKSPLKPDGHGSNIVHRQLLYNIGFRLMNSRKRS